jgi:hypothetical protein
LFELFTKATVVCAAVATFGGGAYVVGSGLSSINESQVTAIVQKMNIAPVSDPAVAVSETVSGIDTLTQGIKKLGKSLSK